MVTYETHRRSSVALIGPTVPDCPSATVPSDEIVTLPPDSVTTDFSVGELSGDGRGPGGGTVDDPANPSGAVGDEQRSSCARVQ
jgi:hypothetical protein